MLSALLPTPGFAQNWTLPVSKLKHVCSLVFVRFRLQTSASNSEQIDVGQMSQKIHAPVAMDLQQNRACSMDKSSSSTFRGNASSSALRGGVAAVLVQTACVPTFMWMHTVTNYQYRYGGTAIDVVRALYAEGGPRRFYRGIVPALLQSAILRFGGLAVNEGLLAATASHGLSSTMAAATSSLATSVLRVVLMPLDAWQTAKQVNGEHGFKRVLEEARSRPSTLWRGTAGSVTSTWAGFYAWCWTNNWLHEVLPKSSFGDSETPRSATIGFAANVAGDASSNFLRVLKTLQQTAGREMTYMSAAKELLRQDGVRGLFGRGLPTKVASSGFQGAVFLMGYDLVLKKLSF